jgi:CheY-like chemotaxis protein
MANVLIVDDDVDLAEVSKDLLESAGHTICVAHNGEEGLATLSAAPLPDCVLLDLDMPVLNGQRMAHRMRLLGSGAERIPILLVSGRDDLSAIAARVGTPYFIKKASAHYCELLLVILGRALLERCAPMSA